MHSAAVLQLRARTGSLADAELQSLLQQDRSLVRLWALRSTVHLFASDDVAALVALRSHMLHLYHRWICERGGLESRQMERLLREVVAALGKQPLSRGALSRLLTPKLGEWARPWLEHSWGGILKLAAARGLLCHRPPGATEEAEREAHFVRLDRWLGPLKPVGPDAGVAQLLRRYLATYGPATAADARKFFGIPAAPLAAAFKRIRRDLIEVDAFDRPHWLLARDEAALRGAAPPPGHLVALPLFDPWLLAHNATDGFIDPRHRKAVYRTAGWISPVLLRQGRVVATWSHRRMADGWAVEITPLARLGKGEVRQALERLRHLAGGAPVRRQTG